MDDAEVVPQPPAPIHDQATLSAAIANFKPTPKEVISGIAPHVFDDRRVRRRRNSTGRPRRRPSTGLACELRRPRTSAETPSPLRISAIITVEELQPQNDILQQRRSSAILPDSAPLPPKSRKPKRIFTIRIDSLKAFATKFRSASVPISARPGH
ncbi:hypothetical protein BDZ89DRAFT_578559 [Hymenopellis radicata]|nr:hypothetical protein BDZ89DRAFT_578559 [Hymenopellis radicata]